MVGSYIIVGNVLGYNFGYNGIGFPIGIILLLLYTIINGGFPILGYLRYNRWECIGNHFFGIILPNIMWRGPEIGGTPIARWMVVVNGKIRSFERDEKNRGTPLLRLMIT